MKKQEFNYYCGINQVSNNNVLCDRTSFKTPSGFVLGPSDFGKTRRYMLPNILQALKKEVLSNDKLPKFEYISEENFEEDMFRTVPLGTFL